MTVRPHAGWQVPRRILREVAGGVLCAAGLVALVLPGPGLLLLFGGLALLANNHRWASRIVGPVRTAALRAAADGVRTPSKALASLAAAGALLATGVFLLLHPHAPAWWPLREPWWIPGGRWTGGTIVTSGMLALGLLGYSWHRLRS